MKRALIAALAICALAPAARAFDDMDRAAVETLREDFTLAFEANDMATVIGFMPPAVINYIAAQANMDADRLTTLMAAQSEQVMAQVTLESFDMDVARMTTGTTAAGRDYALVPTVTAISVGGPAIVTETNTVFFEDDGNWYLLRIENDQQSAVLSDAYPDFQGLDLQ